MFQIKMDNATFLASSPKFAVSSGSALRQVCKVIVPTLVTSLDNLTHSNH